MSKRNRGFTLIELMVVVAVVGILLAIAYPGYRTYTLRARRTEAIKEIMGMVAAEERFHTNCNTYTASLSGSQTTCAGLGYAASPKISENGYYSLTVAGGAATFTISAAPAGAQVADTYCGTLSITDAGVKGKTGTDSVAKCWAQ